MKNQNAPSISVIIATIIAIGLILALYAYTPDMQLRAIGLLITGLFFLGWRVSMAFTGETQHNPSKANAINLLIIVLMFASIIVYMAPNKEIAEASTNPDSTIQTMHETSV